MMKFKILLLTILSAIALAGCNNYDTGNEINSELIDIGNLGENFDLIRDKNTGCVYIQYLVGYKYGITPYYDEEGKVTGCGEENLDKSKYE